jgi:hypothetical protein
LLEREPALQPEKASSIPAAVLTPGQPGEISAAEKLFQVRRALFQAGLIGPVLDIHILHGIDLRLSLLPAKRDVYSLSSGSFFDPAGVLKVYELLLKYQLTLSVLEQELLNRNSPARESRAAGRLDLEMASLLEQAHQEKDLALLLQRDENARTCEEVSRWLWNVCYGFESGCLTGHFNRSELELIGYLALLPKGQSKEQILSDLFEEEKITSERRAFDTRLSRTRSILSGLLKHYLAMYFVEEPGSGGSVGSGQEQAGAGCEPEDRNLLSPENPDDLKSLTARKRFEGEKFDYIQEDGFGKIRLIPGLVRVDDWELMQLLTVAASEKLRNPPLYVQKLEEIHHWIAATARTHGEREGEGEGDGSGALVMASLIGPLGSFGDRCNWEILDHKRTSIMELWYNTNLYLGNFYQRRNTAKAFYHYGQAHAMFPTFEDPVLSLMQISHIEGDTGAIRRVFNNYLKHCRREGVEPATLVEGCYKSFSGDEVKQSSGQGKPEPGLEKPKIRAVNGPKRQYAKS